MADKPKSKSKGGKRTTVLAALLATIALVAMWLSDCIPGFGIGSSGDAEGEAEQVEKQAEQAKEPEPVEPKPEAEAQPSKTLSVTISVHGCSVAGGEPLECEALCEQAELFEDIDDAILEVDGASHGSVVAVTDCLKSKGIDKIAIRRE